LIKKFYKKGHPSKILHKARKIDGSSQRAYSLSLKKGSYPVHESIVAATSP